MMDDNDENDSNRIHPSFNIPQERIDEMVQTYETVKAYFRIITSFADWSTANLHKLDAEEVHSIYKDIVDSNKHIIEKINKILPQEIQKQ